MTSRLRVFVSSVQKELEDERLIVQNLVSTDPFLSTHCTPVLYEYEPASPTKAMEGCIEALDDCHVYLLIVGVQYGTLVGALIVGVFRNGLTLMGVSSVYQILATGILVILAVAADQFSRRGGR
mgnify:CR=1 FL=1